MKILLTLLALSVMLFANKAFIQPDELYEKLNDSKLVLIDTTNLQNYNKGHIRGARHADISAFRHWVDDTYMLMNSSKEIQKAAQSLGINNDSYVVLYGHNNPKELLTASYIALALIVNGFENISILDGGFNAFKSAFAQKQNLISTIVPDFKTGNFKANYNPDILVDMEYVLSRVGETSMIEARPKKFYDGVESSPGVKRKGHIPGAKSSFWQDKFEQNERLADDSKLKKIFLDDNELDKNREVLTYCTGVKDVKLYDASMKEWGNKENTPMQK